MPTPLPPEATSTPYWQLLKIQQPWELRARDVDIIGRRLEFDIAWCESQPLTCPDCHTECSLFDYATERTWRHVNDAKIQVIIRAEMPRCHCPRHGLKAMRPSWSEPGTGYVECSAVKRISPSAQTRQSNQLRLLTQGSQRAYAMAIRIWRPAADTVRRPLTRRMLASIKSPAAAALLPCDPDPPYKAYLCFAAHPLSVLGPAVDIKPLLASDYINLTCLKTLHSQGFIGGTLVPLRSIGSFVVSGHCELYHDTDELSFKWPHSRRLIQWMLDRLRGHWYLLAHINHYYVPNTLSYRKEDFLHDCLIFGYDSQNETFTIALYKVSRTYGTTTVPFAAMAMALTLRGNPRYANPPICHPSALLAVRPKSNVTARFNRDAAYENLHAYLHSSPPHEAAYARDDLAYAGDWTMALGYPTTTHHYGLAAFAAITSHVRTCVEREVSVDMMTLRSLWEHKKMMVSNIEFWATQTPLVDLDRILNSYQDIVKWTHTLYLMCVTLNLNDRSIAPQLTQHLDQAAPMIEVEKKLLTQCYWALGKRSSAR